jgi:hypothetical protein
VNEHSLTFYGDDRVVKELCVFLTDRGVQAEIQSTPATSVAHPFYDLTTDLSIVIITIVGVVKPLLTALTEFHKNHLQHQSQKSFRITLKGDSIEVSGFSADEIKRLASWLSQRINNED